MRSPSRPSIPRTVAAAHLSPAQESAEEFASLERESLQERLDEAMERAQRAEEARKAAQDSAAAAASSLSEAAAAAAEAGVLEAELASATGRVRELEERVERVRRPPLRRPCGPDLPRRPAPTAGG